MRTAGSIIARFRKLIDWHVAEGTDGIVVVGTTGESPTVDFDEHKELIRIAVEHAQGRIPVIAGTGGNSTSEAIELTDSAKKAGATASLSVVPYYNKPTQEGLVPPLPRRLPKRWTCRCCCTTCRAARAPTC
jgi:4-hydroxy-tetrahydrodipicolinate synthase